MSQSNRVWITGRSVVSASGDNAQETWDAILAGRSAITEINQADLSSWPARLGGQIANYQPARMLPDRKLLKVISRQDVLGINAAMQAVNHSGMIDWRDSLSCQQDFNDNTAVYVGSPGNKYAQQYDFLPLLAKTNGDMSLFAKELFNEVHPTWLLRILPNNVLAYTGITYGFKGPNHNVTNHAVGGTQAILEAYHAIQSGQAERAVVVAYDVGIEPQALFYYDRLGVLSARHLKPFDSAHDGTILAEGAAALVLESEASAKARGAVCYGEIAAGFASSEAAGLFSLEADGAPLASLLQKTLDNLQLQASDIDMIVAHGNGNQASDNSEAQAINAVFSTHQVPVTAFKWAMGHTLSASGVLDTVLMTHALQERCVPGIAGFKELATSCHGLNIAANHRILPTKPRHALMINRGFASMNACLVVSSCE